MAPNPGPARAAMGRTEHRLLDPGVLGSNRGGPQPLFTPTGSGWEGPQPLHPDRLRWGGASTPPPKDRVALGTSGPTPPEARVEPQERRATTIVVEGGMQERGRPPPSTARVEHQQCRVKAIAVEKRGPMPARGWNRAQGIPGDDNRGRGRIAGGNRRAPPSEVRVEHEECRGRATWSRELAGHATSDHRRR